MNRRELFAFVGAAAATCSSAAQAQPRDRARRVGVLMHLDADDREGQNRSETDILPDSIRSSALGVI